jgi:hypothetical protein
MIYYDYIGSVSTKLITFCIVETCIWLFYLLPPHDMSFSSMLKSKAKNGMEAKISGLRMVVHVFVTMGNLLVIWASLQRHA